MIKINTKYKIKLWYIFYFYDYIVNFLKISFTNIGYF